MKDKRGYLTPDQLKKLLSLNITARDRVLLLLLIHSGRRISEILELKVKDIHFKDGLINWHIKKRKKKYTDLTPMRREVLQQIKDYIELYGYDEEAYLFQSRKPRNNGTILHPIGRRRAFQLVREWGNKAGIENVGDKKIHPHHFRHTLAVDLAKNSENVGDLILIQRMLGHANIETTMFYLQFSSSDLKKLIGRREV